MKITDEELEMIEKLRSLSPDGLEKALNKLVELAKEQGEDLKHKQKVHSSELTHLSWLFLFYVFIFKIINRCLIFAIRT